MFRAQLYFFFRKFPPLLHIVGKIQQILGGEPPHGRRFSTFRFQMYNQIESYLKKNPVHGKVLMISEGDEKAIREMFPNDCEFITTKYPETDVTNLAKFSTGAFDAVVSDQVLEHVSNPFKAVAEMCRILKKNGVAINTSCSFNPIHDSVDYYRFTSDGFKVLHENFRRIELLGTWGNREAIGRYVTMGYKNFDVRRNKKELELATRNDPKWPWSVWCIARK